MQKKYFRVQIGLDCEATEDEDLFLRFVEKLNSLGLTYIRELDDFFVTNWKEVPESVTAQAELLENVTALIDHFPADSEAEVSLALSRKPESPFGKPV